MVKVLFLSTSDKDGGATAWFLNLAESLYRHDNYEVAMIVKSKHTGLGFVKEIIRHPKKKSFLSRITRLFHKPSRDLFFDSISSYSFFPEETELTRYVEIEDIVKVCPFSPDIIVAGLTYGFVNTNTLSDLHHYWNAPVFMTAYDANVYTGGCHVLCECSGFEKSCDNCPGISTPTRKREVAISFDIKKKNISTAKIGVLYASAWSLYNIKRSACFAHSLAFDIGMCINTDLYTNANRDIAKRVFNLPSSCLMIFAGAVNLKEVRKGSVYFIKSLTFLWDFLPKGIRERVFIMMAGNNIHSLDAFSTELPPFQYKFIDFISDVRLLSLAYQAAEVFVCSSLEDAGPMMAAEALSCGTPVVGFPVGLLYDHSIVRDSVTGYVVESRSSQKMAEAIAKILVLGELEFRTMSEECRNTAIQVFSQEAFISNFTYMVQCLRG